MTPFRTRFTNYSSITCIFLAGLCSCNLIKPLAFVLPEPKTKVPAEFSHLDESVTVLVWVAPEVLYDYPNARLEVGAYVVDELKTKLSEVKCIQSSEVENYLESTGQPAFDPESAGRHFGTKYVLYLELLEFSLRDAHAPDMLRGRIRSAVAVYDLTAKDKPASRFDLHPVEVLVPKDQPENFSRAAVTAVRQATYQEFSGEVVKKFYAYEESSK